VIALSGARTEQDVIDVMNVTRQSLNITTMVALPRINTLILKDTPAKVVLAERLIAELESHMTGASPAVAPAHLAPALTIEIEGAGALFGSGAALFNIEPDGMRRNITPNRSQLQPKTTRPFSLRVTEDVQRAFEILGENGGINVRFDPNFKPDAGKREFRLDNVDLFDALDILSLQTGSFWQVVDNGTIVVAVDNSTTRRANEPQIPRTFHLTNVTTPQDLSNIVNSLRQILNLTGITADTSANTIEVRDTPNKITLSEKLIAALDTPPSPR
jgi:type II secretory pathway component GspD/PulD (secretin)